jgi:large-conductance mechanosensitive channel
MMSATSTLAMTHLVTLADSFDKNKVTPGVLGFIVFAIIGGAVWLLMKSMNKQMKKVDFEEQPEEGETATTASTAPTAAKPKTS